jgi:hypothetical protein
VRPLSRRELLYAAAATAALSKVPGAGARQGVWLAGDLHCHSVYSHDVWSGPDDDNTGPEELYTHGHTPGEQIALATVRGLDFLAITDHNRVESIHAPDYVSSSLTLVPGYEHSLPGSDHAGVFVASRDLLPDVIPASNGTGAWLDEIHARGGMAICNHPFYGNKNDGDALAWDQSLADTQRFDAVEVWNSMWLTRHEVTPVYEPDNHLAVRWWDTTLRCAATGASDNHWKTLDPTAGVGQPTTWVYAPANTPAGVIAGVQAGRTTISWQPPALGGPFLTLDVVEDWSGRAAMVGGSVRGDGQLLAVVTTRNALGMTLRLVANGTEVVHSSRVTASRTEVPLVLPHGGRLRAELLLEERYALTALTSPIHADGRAPAKARREPTRGEPLTYDGSGFATLPAPALHPSMSCTCAH